MFKTHGCQWVVKVWWSLTRVCFLLLDGESESRGPAGPAEGGGSPG